MTRLTELIIKEISGVGEAHGSGPAHGLGDGWMVVKSRGSSTVQAADRLRKALGNDAAFERIVKAVVTDEPIFVGKDAIHVLKDRHSNRNDAGRFHPTPAPPTFPMAGGESAHMLPALARELARASGKKPPADAGRSDHDGIYGDSAHDPMPGHG